MTTCPQCGLGTWRYDGEVFICKNGHRNPVHEATLPVPEPEPTPRIGAVLAGALSGAAVTLLAELVRLLS